MNLAGTFNFVRVKNINQPIEITLQVQNLLPINIQSWFCLHTINITYYRAPDTLSFFYIKHLSLHTFKYTCYQQLYFLHVVIIKKQMLDSKLHFLRITVEIYFRINQNHKSPTLPILQQCYNFYIFLQQLENQPVMFAFKIIQLRNKKYQTDINYRFSCKQLLFNYNYKKINQIQTKVEIYHQKSTTNNLLLTYIYILQ
eukprot:TRINITY_DN19742_c0_g1_i2.p1 TRINITY_DN19742_c0_g1~~TRINITY_DN19742_c0_g1_i2.p1  ORF type:complete len:199 (+),score=-10.13 TRINITY_DN19742_c0_g1_i2:105-701(+)